MADARTLDDLLRQDAGDDPRLQAAAEAIGGLAKAIAEISDLVALGNLAGAMGASHGQANADGDAQKALDLIANEMVVEALRTAPVALVVSEELERPLPLRAGAPIAVAVDPLDGSSNIDTNVSIGTIFSLRAASAELAEGVFLTPGSDQLAGGFAIYGPQTSIVVRLGAGTHIVTLDRRQGVFRVVAQNIRIAGGTREYAINASNYRHWDDPIRAYVDDCIQGSEGPRSADFNMRWIASLVADAYRILIRGGVFLYPADQRKGYQRGRLRLVYEAAPIALLVEGAGGAATNGTDRILDLVAADIHARTPLVFGSTDKVDRVKGYHDGTVALHDRAPLFGRRGLLRV